MFTMDRARRGWLGGVGAAPPRPSAAARQGWSGSAGGCEPSGRGSPGAPARMLALSPRSGSEEEGQVKAEAGLLSSFNARLSPSCWLPASLQSETDRSVPGGPERWCVVVVVVVVHLWGLGTGFVIFILVQRGTFPTAYSLPFGPSLPCAEWAALLLPSSAARLLFFFF